MKKIFSIILLIGCCIVYSQTTYTNGLYPFQTPKEGKALVYITRSGGAFLINFRIYQNNKFIGALSSGNYFLVECEPGKHTFWAASENRDYVDAELEANKVYVIDAEAQMGAFVAGVSLEPQIPSEKKHRKKFYKTVKNENCIVFDENLIKDDKSESIEKGLKKYDELKSENSSKIEILNPNQNFTNADKPE